MTELHYLSATEAIERFRSRTARALEGIPIAIKDRHSLAGHITTHGSLVFRENRDETTLATVQRLLDAGAIVLARSTASEFGCSNITQTRLWGATRNPWRCRT